MKIISLLLAPIVLIAALYIYVSTNGIDNSKRVFGEIRYLETREPVSNDE